MKYAVAFPPLGLPLGPITPPQLSDVRAPAALSDACVIGRAAERPIMGVIYRTTFEPRDHIIGPDPHRPITHRPGPPHYRTWGGPTLSDLAPRKIIGQTEPTDPIVR